MADYRGGKEALHWTHVTVRVPVDMTALHLAAIEDWLRHRPGEYTYRFGYSRVGGQRRTVTYFLSDPDVAFEFRLRWT